MQNRKRGLIIALCSILICFVLFIVFIIGIVTYSAHNLSRLNLSSSTVSHFNEERIDVLSIQGAIGPYEGDMFSTPSYNHEFVLSSLNQLIDDPYSKGLILFIDSPGGSVYHTDEVYLKLLEYKASGRPIYTSFGSMAASGGYYLACAADKIVCNRNTITGSIGVIMQSVLDLSGLLDKWGIKVETITAGDNKAMGNSYEPLTDEQRSIMQSILDETHTQFIEIVAEGRHMDLETVKKLADGRIYTAKQALANGLVDEIGTLEDTVYLLSDDYSFKSLPLNYIQETPISFFDSFFMKLSALSPKTELSSLLQLQDAFTRFGYYYSGPLGY